MSELKIFVANILSTAVNLDKAIKTRRDCYILSYHRVLTAQQAENDGVHHSMWISPERLESQIIWMKTVGEIVDCSTILDSTKPCDQPLFALTFDDGWKDNYVHALPVLRKHDVPALVFLATEAIDSGELFWPQDIATKTRHLLLKGRSDQVVAALCEFWPNGSQPGSSQHIDVFEMVENWIEALKLLTDLERQALISNYYHRLQLSETPLTGYVMNWGEVREMQKHCISFGSHTHRHTILEGLPPDEVETELRYSKARIADMLQIDVNSFCYPNGRYNGYEGAILSRCGYRYGFRLDNLSLTHCSDNYYIPRFLVSERKAAIAPYFKLCLLGVPLYRFKPHKRNMGET